MGTKEHFLHSFDKSWQKLEKLNQSGSGRENYRFYTDNGSYILTVNQNKEENETFFYLTDLFHNLNGNVPKILKVADNGEMYIQQDLGFDTLLQLKNKNFDLAFEQYKKTVKNLAHLQIGSFEIVDKSKLYNSKSFDDMLVYRDLFYFKNYYLDFTNLEYSQAQLLKEFKEIAAEIKSLNYRFLMFRDFQGRNIMIKDDEPFFIDYQDAMEGPIAYDLVSLLWQAKAQLTSAEKENLFAIYSTELHQLLPNNFNINKLRHDYNYCTLIRLMQVMGAYGKLGLIQQKPHFKESLTFGMENLKTFATNEIMENFPLLQKLFKQMDNLDVTKIKS